MEFNSAMLTPRPLWSTAEAPPTAHRRATDITFHARFEIPSSPREEPTAAQPYRVRGQNNLTRHIYPQPSVALLPVATAAPMDEPSAAQPSLVRGKRDLHGGIYPQPSLLALTPRAGQADGPFYNGWARRDAGHVPQSARRSAAPEDYSPRFPKRPTDVSQPQMQNPGPASARGPATALFDDILLDHGGGRRVDNGPHPLRQSDVSQPWRQTEASSSETPAERNYWLNRRNSMLDAPPVVPTGRRGTDVTLLSPRPRVEKFCEVWPSGRLRPPAFGGEASDIQTGKLDAEYHALRRKMTEYVGEERHGRRGHRMLSAHVNSTIHA